MPDIMDAVQDRVLQETQAAIAHATTRRAGCSECEECGAAISASRQQLGARLCIEHQRAAEAKTSGPRRGCW